MFGQSAPIDPTVWFTDQIKALQASVAELERLANVPRSVAAASTDTTDGSGDIVVTHGLGTTPTAVVVTARVSSAVPRIQAKTSTTFTVRFLDFAGAALTATSIGFDWIAHR